jgi:hypothetical protein
MTTNYDGLTRNNWPGTWVPSGNFPIALDTELRGGLQSLSGTLGDRLTDISGQRLQEGMLVYLKTGYTAGAVTRTANTYYTYKLKAGEVRDAATGSMPNNEDNWSLAAMGSTGATGPDEDSAAAAAAAASDADLAAAMSASNTSATSLSVL